MSIRHIQAERQRVAFPWPVPDIVQKHHGVVDIEAVTSGYQTFASCGQQSSALEILEILKTAQDKVDKLSFAELSRINLPQARRRHAVTCYSEHNSTTFALEYLQMSRRKIQDHFAYSGSFELAPRESSSETGVSDGCSYFRHL